MNPIRPQDEQIVLRTDENVVARALYERASEMLEFLLLDILLDRNPPFTVVHELEAAHTSAVTGRVACRVTDTGIVTGAVTGVMHAGAVTGVVHASRMAGRVACRVASVVTGFFQPH